MGAVNEKLLDASVAIENPDGSKITIDGLKFDAQTNTIVIPPERLPIEIELPLTD